MVSLLVEIGLILVIATIVSIIGKSIKQPLLIAYIITGILISPLLLDLPLSSETLQSFAHLGVALLLFTVGIGLDFRILKQVGKLSIIAGTITMLLMGLFVFLAAQLFDFSPMSSIYIAIAFTFSSTVVVVKVLSDKKEKDTLHGRIAIGILVIEAFIAAIILILLPVLSTGSLSGLGLQLSKGIGIIAAVILIGKFVLPRLTSIAAKSQELLFLFSLSWALLVGLVFAQVGFSLEIGALLAGMALASSRYSVEMGSKIATVRDFFVILFFVFFGSQLAGPITGSLIGKAIVFSFLILIGKPIILMAIMRRFGYNKRTNFLAGASLAQVSELSLIVILLGFSRGYLSQDMLSLSILVAVITIAISSYAMYFSEPIYCRLSQLLSIFDGKNVKESDITEGMKYDVILFGYDRLGYNILKAFHAAKKKYLIVDYNPSTILRLSERKIPCIYGDVRDSEFLDSLPLEKTPVIISTIPDFEINASILSQISKKTLFITTSHEIENALKLYKLGVDYVIMPHFLGGEFMAHLLMRERFNKKAIHNEGKLQIKDLENRQTEGHYHPRDFHR